MNRRSFLGFLGVGAAAAVVAPSVIESALTPTPDKLANYVDYAKSDEIGGWVSYKFRYTVSLPPTRATQMRYTRE